MWCKFQVWCVVISKYSEFGHLYFCVLLNWLTAKCLWLHHSTCQACMNVRDAKGQTIMDRLIAKLPDAAMVILTNICDFISDTCRYNCAIEGTLVMISYLLIFVWVCHLYYFCMYCVNALVQLFQIVMDHCIDRTVRDDEERSVTVCDCCIAECLNAKRPFPV